MQRRRFLHQAMFGAAGLGLGRSATRVRQERPILKPPRLKPGDTVGLVSPAGATYDALDVTLAEERMAALGLQTKRGTHVLARRGYLAGTDAERADDLNRMFADPEVDAILAMRGGWGAARLLPLLDYDAVRETPKLLFGYSDVTSLLLALYVHSGLVTIHGPTGISTWNPFTVDLFRRLLFDGEALEMRNPVRDEDRLVQVEDRIRTITPGTARGRLAGGNLTVLTSLVGSAYLPDFTGHILFLEDIGEDVYRVDRMLTQLKLAGILDQLAGFVFGKCTDCDAGSSYGSLTLHEVFVDHIEALGIPAWHGAMIGHIKDKFTVPLGVEAEIDAARGSIRLLEPAVR